MDELVKINNERIRRENQLGLQVAHKALDEPMLGDSDMEVQANKTTVNNGLGWKELAIIAGAIVGTGGTAAYLTADRSTDQNPPAVTPDAGSDSVVVPGIRFGPPKE